jgi:thiol:disulfide interchange protein DsbC
MNYTDFRPGFKARAATAALALTTAFAVVSLGLAAVTSAPAQASDTSSAVRAALKARLPKTPIDALTCEGFGGLCEVVSGSTLFYVDGSARYLLVGRLYDM